MDRSSCGSVEESIINALIATATMTGQDGYRAPAIDHQELRKLLKDYKRLTPFSKDMHAAWAESLQLHCHRCRA